MIFEIMELISTGGSPVFISSRDVSNVFVYYLTKLVQLYYPTLYV